MRDFKINDIVTIHDHHIYNGCSGIVTKLVNWSSMADYYCIVTFPDNETKLAFMPRELELYSKGA